MLSSAFVSFAVDVEPWSILPFDWPATGETDIIAKIRVKDNSRAVFICTPKKDCDSRPRFIMTHERFVIVVCSEKGLCQSRLVPLPVATARLVVPAQPVDATPFNQFIRQYFPLANRPVWRYSIRPSQGGVPFESAP